MYGDSTVYTVGTALNRAQDSHVEVRVLVEGVWLAGQVVAVDGHGVVLESNEFEHAVIRIGSVSAVQVSSPAPQHAPITRGAMPMPAC